MQIGSYTLATCNCFVRELKKRDEAVCIKVIINQNDLQLLVVVFFYTFNHLNIITARLPLFYVANHNDIRMNQHHNNCGQRHIWSNHFPLRWHLFVWLQFVGDRTKWLLAWPQSMKTVLLIAKHMSMCKIRIVYEIK